MSRPGLILLGAGGHARACIDVIEQERRYRIAGLLGATAELGAVNCGYRVIGADDALAHLRAQYQYAFVGIGQIHSPDIRMRVFKQLLDLGFELPAIVAPTAYVSPHAKIGPGSIVMHGAIVNAGASIGSNCIINSRALIEHDVVVHDHCHVSTGAILNGNVVLGEESFVGSGSIVREGLIVARGSLLSMGSVLKKTS
jgi:sugar O-acyltransferase (sialic acid O-acetyltransferase NeuD family)